MRGHRTAVGGRTVLITGAASGIGRATAHAVARRGGRVLLTDLREEPLHETAAAIRSAGGTVAGVAPADVSDREQVFGLRERFGPADVVMNVAGTSLWGPVERLAEEHWRHLVEVDLMGPIHVISAFVPPMIEAGKGGHVVNVASAAALLGLPWHAAYSAAKFGLRGVSEVLRFDLHRHRIGVTLVCPGAVATPLVNTIRIVGVDREHPAAKKLADRFVKHAKTPEQVAESILEGVEGGKAMVFTSPDIRAAFLLQRVFPPAYEAIMLKLNRELVRVGEQASVA